MLLKTKSKRLWFLINAKKINVITVVNKSFNYLYAESEKKIIIKKKKVKSINELSSFLDDLFSAWI